mmetsp:Transcript_8731/g.15393  ORF Transcript_8731/g.15393 Transcript_8731/m.15393 type:complete len:138 (-) Transcript_8731:62-475(-)
MPLGELNPSEETLLSWLGFNDKNEIPLMFFDNMMEPLSSFISIPLASSIEKDADEGDSEAVISPRGSSRTFDHPVLRTAIRRDEGQSLAPASRPITITSSGRFQREHVIINVSDPAVGESDYSALPRTQRDLDLPMV